MAKGDNTITNLTNREYEAAISAIKLVRGEVVKNAYSEGWSDGYKSAQQQYRGEKMTHYIDGWEQSQTKMLEDIKNQ